jgi:hypothetical protein
MLNFRDYNTKKKKKIGPIEWPSHFVHHNYSYKALQCDSELYVSVISILLRSGGIPWSHATSKVESKDS